jgi:ribose transport system substrate-binding protein
MPLGSSNKLLVVAAAILCAWAGAVNAQYAEPNGITDPVVLPPFDPTLHACSKPEKLSATLAFAKDNQREFVEGIDHGLAMAARDRGLQYEVALAGNDAAQMVDQINAFSKARVGALVVSPVDPAAVAPSLKQMIWSGAYVGAVVPPPATTILNAPQYLTGKELGDAAVMYIEKQLGGKADVVLLTQDSIQFLTPRFVAIRDALSRLPGVRVIADISPSPVSKEGGLATMRTILLAHDKIDVVLGADGVVLGALDALREAGKDRPDQFLGGIDGEPEAVSEIKRGGPYKVSISLNSPVFGYAMGQHAADWLEGKQIPQAMDILPRALNNANVSAYEADLANPAAVFRDETRRNSYLKMYGNICYDTREKYLNFPWSSEAQ